MLAANPHRFLFCVSFTYKNFFLVPYIHCFIICQVFCYYFLLAQNWQEATPPRLQACTTKRTKGQQWHHFCNRAAGTEAPQNGREDNKWGTTNRGRMVEVARVQAFHHLCSFPHSLSVLLTSASQGTRWVPCLTSTDPSSSSSTSHSACTAGLLSYTHYGKPLLTRFRSYTLR